MSYLTVICLAFLFVTSVQCACPSFTTSSDGLCLFMNRGYKNWYKANAFCESVGCSLNWSDDSTTQAALQSYASTAGVSSDFWVGINDNLEEGTWVVWNGTETTAITWQSGSPTTNTNDANCAYVKSSSAYELDDSRCTNEKKFLCQCSEV